VELDGRPFDASRSLSADDLRRGLILTVGRRFVFCLHGVRFPVARSPDLGLLGAGDAIEEVRRTILRVAPRDVSVLIRGETGTGKENAARAIHAYSGRANGPFVDVNTASLRPERAAADLFGYEKGAFTGATEARPGYFRAAQGGTLFLDEIGLIVVEIQQALLRVLQDHRVHPLGAAQPRPVDVRLVAATDARLEDLLAEGRLLESFFHRLNSSFTLSLPPLRDRREDIGVLLAHFLQRELKATGELERLNESGADERPWLTARTVAQIAMGQWPGNVRALEGLAKNLATESADNPDVDTHALVTGYPTAYRITSVGAQFLDLDEDHPLLPDFVERVVARCPDLPDEVAVHLSDAHSCVEHGLGRPAVVLAGLAYEAAEDAIIDHLGNRVSVKSGAGAAARIAAVRKAIPTLMPDLEERGRADAAWDFADRLRERRNNGSHPRSYPDFSDLSEVHELLLSAGRHLPGLWSVRV
jgi:hypothetical protein